MSYSKYYIYKEQTSTDGGASWQYTGNETPSGESIGTYSTLQECEGSGPTPPGPSPYENQYFTIVPKSSGIIKLDNTIETFSYSYDNGSTWNNATSAINITMTSGQNIILKGTISPRFGEGIGTFSASTNTQFEIEGNVMSLLFGDNFIGQKSLTGKSYAFYNLFSGGTGLASIDNLVLPATTLSDRCYQGMFMECKSLTTVPKDLLPATTLAVDCYGSMFHSCSAIKDAPDLPATVLAKECYSHMFLGCKALTKSPVLPGVELLDSSYGCMFSGCTHLSEVTCFAETGINVNGSTSIWLRKTPQYGTFTKKSGVTWPSGVSGIPSDWTVVEV